MNTKLSIHTATILMLLVLFAGLASAQQMNYQGRLTDASGNGLADGSYTLRFKVYETDTGGGSGWGPSDVAATLVNGRFNVILGEDDGATPTRRKLKDAFTTDTPRYLGITLIDAVTNPGNVEISPRQQILSSPNAMFANHAANADTAMNATNATHATTANTAANFTSVVLKTDETLERVGVGTSSPSAKLDVNGDAVLGGPVAGSHFLVTGNQIQQYSGASPAPMYLNLSGGNVSLGSANSKVGIGTTSPAGRLHVAGAETAQMTLGSPSGVTLAVGNATAKFGLNFGVNGNGNSWIQGGRTDGVATPYDISLQASGGNVGIGTVTPTKGRLEVRGGPDSIGGNYGYLRVGFVYSGGASLAAGAHQISIYAENSVEASEILLHSDERIKHIDGRSDQVDDLATLLAIEVTDYTYIDTIGKGNRKQKKVIAQQVEKVYPLAVSKSTDEIPDIYQNATIVDGWIMLATDLKVGERVRLIGSKEKAIYPVVEVEEKRFRVANFVPEGDEVFVFGREVDDFRTVDYDAIAMLNVSATQELTRQLAAKDARIAALEKSLAELQSKDEARDAKLTAIEAMLSSDTVQARTVSLSR